MNVLRKPRNSPSCSSEASPAPWIVSPGSLLWPFRLSINLLSDCGGQLTLWIAPSGENGHIRNSKKPKPRGFTLSSALITHWTMVQWKMGWRPKTIIAAIVLVVTQSLKCNIQEGHFITSNRASIMCKICSLNGLAIISIISGCSEG